MAVDPNEAPKGHAAVDAGRGSSCPHCAFKSKDCSQILDCRSFKRRDKANVYYVEKRSRFTTNSPKLYDAKP